MTKFELQRAIMLEGMYLTGKEKKPELKAIYNRMREVMRGCACSESKLFGLLK